MEFYIQLNVFTLEVNFFKKLPQLVVLQIFDSSYLRFEDQTRIVIRQIWNIF